MLGCDITSCAGQTLTFSAKRVFSNHASPSAGCKQPWCGVPTAFFANGTIDGMRLYNTKLWTQQYQFQKVE